MSTLHYTAPPTRTSVESASPVFVVDGAQRVVEMNEAARALIGAPDVQQVSGMPCHLVIGGHELDGTTLCKPGCEPMRRIAAGELPMPCKMLLRQGAPAPADGSAPAEASPSRWVPCEWQHVVFHTGVNGNGLRVMHVGRSLQRMEAVLRFSEQVLAAAHTLIVEETTSASPLLQLTPQERRVVRLLCDGHDTPVIADVLGVSATTVRNHVQHILRKLGCHSRLEAVALAQRFISSGTIQTAERAMDLLDI